jgi:type II secretory pathway pseudopilin PulG
VTLIELMIAILIISILAAALLGVAAVAGETAREAKTRNMIARLHTLLMEQLDTYKTRRVKVRRAILDDIRTNGTLSTGTRKRQARAEARLYALREMMLMEIPDRWSDVLLTAVPSPPSSFVRVPPLYLDVPDSTQRTEISNVYLRRFRRIADSINTLTGQPNTAADVIANQGAECLYLVIMTATGDGEARSLFGESSIGDTDGDGAPEFLDGWGHPIEFLRWVPGFESDIQANAYRFDNPTPAEPNSDADWVTAANADHDPYDLFRVEPAAFRLVPLIYSAGRDEEFGLVRDEEYVTWRQNTTPSPSYRAVGPPFVGPPLSPYRRTAGPSIYLGSDDGARTATDNIHNHLLGER